MAFNFSQCQSLILQGILDGLRLSADEIAGIEKVPNIESPVTGVSLDLVPWHGALGVSLRLFLAGAEALLDPRVAQLLEQLEINAPTYSDGFLSPRFEYMVFDFDKTVSANYCELVLANRVTAKWTSRLT